PRLHGPPQPLSTSRREASRTKNRRQPKLNSLVTLHAGSARHLEETGHRMGERRQWPWCVVPKEVGAPASRISLALGANVQTPRHDDLRAGTWTRGSTTT